MSFCILVLVCLVCVNSRIIFILCIGEVLVENVELDCNGLVRMCVFVCMCVCVCICMYMRVCICMWVCVSVCVCVCMCAWMYVCGRVPACLHVCCLCVSICINKLMSKRIFLIKHL